MTALKILLTVVILLLLFFPLLPLSKKLKRFSTFRALRYDAPNNRINSFFLLLAIVELILMVAVFRLFAWLASGITSIGFISRLLANVSASLDFRVTVVTTVLVNLIAIYLLVFFKGMLKLVLDRFFGLRKKKKKKKKAEEEEKKPEEKKEEEEPKKKKRFFAFFRSRKKKEKKEELEEEDDGEPLPTRKTHAEDEKFQEEHPILYRIYIKFWGLFFEAPDLKYARRYVHAATAIVQFFIYVVEILYALLFLLLLLGVFFRLPNFVYVILNFATAKLYIYPFISLVFLQELCNTFRAPCRPLEKTQHKLEREEKEKKEEKRIALDKLRRDLLRRFAKNHSIRYYPAVDGKNVAEYECTNEIYRDSMEYIGTYMRYNYGKAIQSYMSGLDAVFNGRHVYFGSSFYSQLGEYVIAYTYVRLLAGYRVIFIVSDRSKVEGLQQYIGNRLTEITGVTREETWRVYSADSNHLNEADVLVGVPEDFASDNIVENFPAFFEEACNAIFVDADKILNLNSYLCSIMACRLFAATENKIRFMFISRDVLQGFSASLRKFFCIDEDVVDCNSAEENEHVSYMLWNRESNLLYNKDGQSETTLETLIAEAAYGDHVDGIRILTYVPLKPAEKQNFQAHDVEINRFYKQVPRVNYLIYTDERCNLAAAIYAYTRFHGREDSILHILSRPYLLREYFGDRVEMYVNRSDLIKPRAAEHADGEKILLVRLLCEATSDSTGMPISLFREKIDAALKERGLPRSFDINGAVAFLLSELMFNPAIRETGVEKHSDGSEEPVSVANKNFPVHSYYTLIQPEPKDGYQLDLELHISFLRMEEVFHALLLQNTRVQLSLHGTIIGALDTFPERVHQQYLPGQYIIYENHEYEIDKIADDSTVIYLRQENITNNTCLDTAFLRRYTIKRKEDFGKRHGVHHYTTGLLKEIDVGYESAQIFGETYGFYRLMANSQTLDFVKGVVGNPTLDDKTIKAQCRTLPGGKILTVRLVSRGECSDGTRKLLAAVLNEFLRTMFPETFRCVAVCPVLLTPTVPEEIEDKFSRDVETLYPYVIKPDETVVATSNVAEFLIINDANEDVGILDRLYDGSARIMEELFSYIYDYLSWLASHPELPEGEAHYIYFGSETLPEIYDLPGSLELLANCARVMGIEETEDDATEKPTHCSFCSRPLVSGRYGTYDNNRFICFDCQVEAVSEDADLQKALANVKKYWGERFPDRPMPEGVTFELADPFSLKPGEEISEHFSRLNYEERKVEIECDLPQKCVEVAILRGYLSIFHRDEKLITPAAEGQLYYEEFAYLASVGATERIEFTREAIRETWLPFVEDIEKFVAETPEGETRDSFDYLAEHAIPVDDKDVLPTPGTDSETGDAGLESLYDPDKVPRFWKRYLRGKRATDEDDDKDVPPVPPAEEDSEESEEDPEEPEESEDLEASEEDPEPKPEEKKDEKKEPAPKPEEKKDEKKPAPKKKKRSGWFSKFKTGEELIPYEEEEETNPQIRLYNEIARHCADFSSEVIPCSDLSKEDIFKVFWFVLCDYPEFFWLRSVYSDIVTTRDNRFVGISLCFRCLKNDGTVDLDRIQKYRKELRAQVKYFTKGITRKTHPYDAMLIIYRRLILNLDYDDVQLAQQKKEIEEKNYRLDEEDVLRSLHSTLVGRKVVCAGYAVAMQYLLQSVGICCGKVTSKGAKPHAWNVVKLGRYCYYLDATWGESSYTSTGAKNQNLVGYGYFCVPEKENLYGNDSGCREPRIDAFEDLEEFRATQHEYCRAHGTYLTSFDEEQIARAIAATAKEKPFEKMIPCTFFRCASKPLFDVCIRELFKNGGLGRALTRARTLLEAEGKNKKALKLLEGDIKWGGIEENCTFWIIFGKE